MYTHRIESTVFQLCALNCVYNCWLGENMCLFTESEKNPQRTIWMRIFFSLWNYSTIILTTFGWTNLMICGYGKTLFWWRNHCSNSEEFLWWNCQAKISLMLTRFFVHKSVHTVKSHLDVLAENRLGAISIQCWESLQFIETKRFWVEWSEKRRRRNEREIESEREWNNNSGKKEHRMKHVTISLTKYRWTMWTLTSNDVLVHPKRSHSNCDPIETHWNNNERVTAKRNREKIKWKKGAKKATN